MEGINGGYKGTLCEVNSLDLRRVINQINCPQECKSSHPEVDLKNGEGDSTATGTNFSQVIMKQTLTIR